MRLLSLLFIFLRCALCLSLDVAQKCSANEVWNPCPGYCTFDADCGSYVEGYVRDCAAPPQKPMPCVPRCDCKPGFLRINSTCFTPDKCCPDPNSHLVNCPAPCEETCDLQPVSADCKIQCRLRKCVCKPGYVRDLLAPFQCILKSECKKKCNGLNEEFSECACPPSCHNISPSCENCTPGCVCQKGYLRHNGKCILPSQCPNRVCGANEEINMCPGYCTFDADCGSYVEGIVRDCARPPPEWEVNYPCHPRCDCKQGFVRINGTCVTPYKCCSDPNSHLVDCPAPCEESCDLKPVKPGCKVQCSLRKCVCQVGFVRDYQSPFLCIPRRECFRRCGGPNEEFSNCVCPATCDNRTPDCTGCIPGCTCRKGFLRDNGRCIPPSQCPTKCTGVNEEYQSCGSACPPTCRNLNPICIQKCTPGCFCKKGFVRKNGKCVKPNEC